MKHKIILPLLIAFLTFNSSCATQKKMSGRGADKSAATSRNFLTGISPSADGDKLDLVIEGSGKVQYTVFKLDKPRRLVIDMPDIDASAFGTPIDVQNDLVTSISTHFFAKTGNSRVEVFLKKPALYTVTRVTDNKILLSMNLADRDMGPEREIGENETEITNVELRESSGLARVVISYKGPKPKYRMVRKREMNRITLDIYNAKIKRANEKLLTVTVKESNVSNVAAFQFRTKPTGTVKILANLNDFTSSNVFERDGELILDMGSDAILASTSPVQEKEAPSVIEVSGKKEKTSEDYTGTTISLDFQNASIHNILRILADVSGLNIITSEKVDGKVTMKLKDVPWDLALDIVLKNNRLGMVRNGNIIRVATLEELAAEKQAMASDVKAGAEVEELYLKVFPVNYEAADKLKANLSSIKSDRGTIDINERTNTLIIQDTKSRLAEMEKLIEVLDKRTVQVLIEARIVEVSHTYAKELGIKWGGQFTRTTGAKFPATVGLSGLSSGGSPSSLAGSIVNLGTTGGATGALGLRLGSVDNTALLDMQLTALQNDGKGKIISMPKIATMNNKEAIIESGREIPYQTTSADGTKTEFKKATLALQVTPHVTQDDFIRLQIDASKDEPDFANQLPGAPPPILTKHAKTEVLVKNGDTTVIGGLFKENATTTQASVPLFSKVPVLGWLFKNKADSKEGEELLIFITPKTL